MAKFQKKEQNDPIANALHAVTAGAGNPPQADEASIAAHAAHQAKQPPVDNDHVATGATKFTPAEIAANKVPAPTVKAAPERPKLKGQEWRLKPKGNMHNSWDFTAQRGTIVEDLLLPGYWADMAQKFRPFDEVTVICEDGTWRADFQIISTDKQWTKVFLLNQWDFTKSYENMPKTQEEEYEITWTVMGKYAICKKDMRGQPPLRDGFDTKHAAYEWLDQHLKTLNS